MKSWLFSCVVTSLLSTAPAWALAPVEDASADYEASALNVTGSEGVAVPDERRSVVEHTVATSEEGWQRQAEPATAEEEPASSNPAPAVSRVDTSGMSMGQRVSHLEQQVNNIANMNMPQQVAALQQQVAELRGQVAVQEHEAQVLKKQLADFYKDLDSRLSRTNAPVVATSNKAQTSEVSSSASLLQDANTYQAAFALLTQHKYTEAKQAFSNYLTHYADGKYAADAHYWLGEIYLLNKDPLHAESEFQTVVSHYPQSAKVLDAKLKTAIIHANSGKTEQAKVEFLEIKKKNPNSTAAQLANIRLQQMEQAH